MFFKKKLTPEIHRLPPHLRPPPPKKRKFPWAIFATLLFCIWFVVKSATTDLPEIASPTKLYSNQCRQDIQITLLEAIRSANSSIHLVMFGLSDQPILSAIKTKIDKNIPTSIYYDPTASPKIENILQGACIQPVKGSGLMHQKILIVDEETVFIGSANMTTASLKMHDNLVLGFKSRNAARFLLEHKPFTSGYFKTNVGGQDLELWLLPDPRGHAFTELKHKIRAASRSIKIALFTFTHPALIDEVIEAQRRGVNVSIVIDMHSGLGASAKAVDRLKKAGIKIGLSQGVQLLHHKFIYIDGKTLITGSANWTKAAFYKNSDCFLALHNLNKEQRKFMNLLWSKIETAAKKPPEGVSTKY